MLRYVFIIAALSLTLVSGCKLKDPKILNCEGVVLAVRDCKIGWQGKSECTFTNLSQADGNHNVRAWSFDSSGVLLEVMYLGLGNLAPATSMRNAFYVHRDADEVIICSLNPADPNVRSHIRSGLLSLTPVPSSTAGGR